MLLVRKEKYVYSVCCDVISVGMVSKVLCGDIWVMIYYVYVTAVRVERMREDVCSVGKVYLEVSLLGYA